MEAGHHRLHLHVDGPFQEFAEVIVAEEINAILEKLERLVRDGGDESVEGDLYELKPVPSDGGSWHQITISANAFLNTRGGILILGVKENRRENGAWPEGRYKFTGWREDNENTLKKVPEKFADLDGHNLDVNDYFRPLMVRPFLDGQVALQFVDEMPADRKYVLLRVDGRHVKLQGEGYKRVGTGDRPLTTSEIDAQREYQEESRSARELQPVPGTCLESIDLNQLNDFITRLNSAARRKVETPKSNLDSARSFLERKSFLVDGQVTLLGMLICGGNVADHLEFRCQVHGYVKAPDETILDKQDMADNVFPLIEASNVYVLRNIQVGVGIERGGVSKPQYPETLLRETVNNSLAHRDYSINKQDVILIKQNESLSIKNPGAFRRHLLIEDADGPRLIRRIIPEAKPRNPKLASNLRAFNKWEGLGIGMSTMVSYCLENRIDLPYYRLGTEEVELVLRPGLLVGDRMERYFRSFSGYLREKLGGVPPSDAQKLVLAYLIKSQWENDRYRYTILLSPDNNHSEELVRLRDAGLVREHPRPGSLPVFIVDATLADNNDTAPLREMFGIAFDDLDESARKVLAIVYRHNQFAEGLDRFPSAKDVSFALWYEAHSSSRDDIRAFDSLYRTIRATFNKLQARKFVVPIDRKPPRGRGYNLNEHFREGRLM